MAPTTDSFAERVRWLVYASGLKQRALSERAGLSGSVVSHWVHGTRTNPKTDAVRKLAQVTGCSLEWLLLGSGVPPTQEQVKAAVSKAA